MAERMAGPGPGLRIACCILFLLHTSLAAPVIENEEEGQTQLQEYIGQEVESTGCYYNFQHYDEGDRIITNEPCLNCTCHNRMLMCYLRVCPFSKAIGQDCTIEKRADQCCPIINCPEVPVQLLTSSTTEHSEAPVPQISDTSLGHLDDFGCKINDYFYTDGAQVPGDPTKPCELCYCIRNRTACVMQECTLRVEGCRPLYEEGVCCPVRYDCDYEEEPRTTTTETPRPTPGLVLTTTAAGPLDCHHNGHTYADGSSIETIGPCEHCYCMRGEIVCAVQECGTPLDKQNCTALPPPPGTCCPETYHCDQNEIEGGSDTSFRQDRKHDTHVNVTTDFEPTTEPEVEAIVSEIYPRPEKPPVTENVEQLTEKPLHINEIPNRFGEEHVPVTDKAIIDKEEEVTSVGPTKDNSEEQKKGSSEVQATAIPEVFSSEAAGGDKGGETGSQVSETTETSQVESNEQTTEVPAIHESTSFESSSTAPELGALPESVSQEVTEKTQSTKDREEALSGNTESSLTEITTGGEIIEQQTEQVHLSPSTESEGLSEATEGPVQATAAPFQATEVPIQATEGAVQSTGEPVQATEAPLLATELPAQATEGSVQVSEGPVQATESPVLATEVPVQATEGSVQVSEGPVQATESPVPATEVPVQATEGSVQVSEGPVQATESPVPATEVPVQVTEGSVQVTEGPVEATEAPVKNTEATLHIEADTEEDIQVTEAPEETTENETAEVSRPEQDHTVHQEIRPIGTEMSLEGIESVTESVDYTVRDNSASQTQMSSTELNRPEEVTESSPESLQTIDSGSLATSKPVVIETGTELGGASNTSEKSETESKPIQTEEQSHVLEIVSSTLNPDRIVFPQETTEESEEAYPAEVSEENMPEETSSEIGESATIAPEAPHKESVTEAQEGPEVQSTEEHTPEMNEPMQNAMSPTESVVYATEEPFQVSAATKPDEGSQKENEDAVSTEITTGSAVEIPEKTPEVSEVGEPVTEEVNASEGSKTPANAGTTEKSQSVHHDESEPEATQIPKEEESLEKEGIVTVVSGKPEEATESITEEETPLLSTVEVDEEVPVTTERSSQVSEENEGENVTPSVIETGAPESHETEKEETASPQQVTEVEKLPSPETAEAEAESTTKGIKEQGYIEPEQHEDITESSKLPQVTATEEPDFLQPMTTGPIFGVVPGEGNCLVENTTYANNTEIPPASKCQKTCRCVSSIVHCVLVNCYPPPPGMKHCTPHYKADECCPSYLCDVEELPSLESGSHVTDEGVTVVNRFEAFSTSKEEKVTETYGNQRPLAESTGKWQEPEATTLPGLKRPEEVPKVSENNVENEAEPPKPDVPLPPVPEVPVTTVAPIVTIPEVTTFAAPSESLTELEHGNVISGNEQFQEEEKNTETEHTPTEKESVGINEAAPESDDQQSTIPEEELAATTVVPSVISEIKTEKTVEGGSESVPVAETDETISEGPTATEGPAPEEIVTKEPEVTHGVISSSEPNTTEEGLQNTSEQSTETLLITHETPEKSPENTSGVEIEPVYSETTTVPEKEENGVEIETGNKIPSHDHEEVPSEETTPPTEDVETTAGPEKFSNAITVVTPSVEEAETSLPHASENPAEADIESVTSTEASTSVQTGEGPINVVSETSAPEEELGPASETTERINSDTPETTSVQENEFNGTENDQAVESVTHVTAPETTERINSGIPETASEHQNEVSVTENEQVSSSSSFSNEGNPQTSATTEKEVVAETTLSSIQNTSNEGSKYEETSIESQVTEEGVPEEIVPQTDVSSTSIQPASETESEHISEGTEGPGISLETSTLTEISIEGEQGTESAEISTLSAAGGVNSNIPDQQTEKIGIHPSESVEGDKGEELHTEMPELSTIATVGEEQPEQQTVSTVDEGFEGHEQNTVVPEQQTVTEEYKRPTETETQTEASEVQTEAPQNSSEEVNGEEPTVPPEIHSETSPNLEADNLINPTTIPPSDFEKVPEQQTEAPQTASEESEPAPEEHKETSHQTGHQTEPTVSPEVVNAPELQTKLPQTSDEDNNSKLVTQVPVVSSETSADEETDKQSGETEAPPTDVNNIPEEQTETSSEKVEVEQQTQVPEIESETPSGENTEQTEASPTDVEKIQEHGTETSELQTEAPSPEPEMITQRVTELPQYSTEKSNVSQEEVPQVTTPESIGETQSTERVEEEKLGTPEAPSTVSPNAPADTVHLTTQRPEHETSSNELETLEQNTVVPEKITSQPSIMTEEATTKTEVVTTQSPSENISNATGEPEEEVKGTTTASAVTTLSAQEISSIEPEMPEITIEVSKQTEAPVRVPPVMSEMTSTEAQKRPSTTEPSEGYDYQKPINPLVEKPQKPTKPEDYDNIEENEEKPAGQEYLPPDEDYEEEEEQPYGPGTCRYAGKVYVSAQQIPRDDPCDFCFCFRSDIICLQQSCPPPIPGCHEEPISGFCCPRYECHVRMATMVNVTSTTTTTTTTVPPHFFAHAYKGTAARMGCLVQGRAYSVGQSIASASGPCMDCICGGDGSMKCEPKVCTPEPMIRKMMVGPDTKLKQR